MRKKQTLASLRREVKQWRDNVMGEEKRGDMIKESLVRMTAARDRTVELSLKHVAHIEELEKQLINLKEELEHAQKEFGALFLSNSRAMDVSVNFTRKQQSNVTKDEISQRPMTAARLTNEANLYNIKPQTLESWKQLGEQSLPQRKASLDAVLDLLTGKCDAQT